MRKYIIKMLRAYNNALCFILLTMLFISACTALGPHYSYYYGSEKVVTYSIYRPFVSCSEYRGGHWNDWRRDIYLRYRTLGYPNFEIQFYNKYNSIVDFEYKIIAKSRRADDKQWEVYDGEIQIKKSNEASMRSKYAKDITGVNALKNVWTFPAIIKRTRSKLPEGKYIQPYIPIDMMYTYNIFYNGVGRAFTIDGIWVGADEYDSW